MFANLTDELKLHEISIQNKLEEDYLSEIGPRTQLVMELQVNWVKITKKKGHFNQG